MADEKEQGDTAITVFGSSDHAALETVLNKEQSDIRKFFDRIDQQDNPSFREKLRQAVQYDDWEGRIRATVREEFDRLRRHPEDQRKLLRWYGRDMSDVSADDQWYQWQLTRIAFLEGPQITQTQASSTQLPEPQTTRSTNRKGRPKNSKVQDRRQKITEIPRGITGVEYCKLLDFAEISTPKAWQEQRCPKRYEDAYNYANPTLRNKWRSRIWNERNNALRATTRHKS